MTEKKWHKIFKVLLKWVTIAWILSSSHQIHMEITPSTCHEITMHDYISNLSKEFCKNPKGKVYSNMLMWSEGAWLLSQNILLLWYVVHIWRALFLSKNSVKLIGTFLREQCQLLCTSINWIAVSWSEAGRSLDLAVC